MPATIHQIGSEALTAREIARRVGISESQAHERIKKGADLLAPKASKREAARRNPDPFGHKARAAQRISIDRIYGREGRA